MLIFSESILFHMSKAQCHQVKEYGDKVGPHSDTDITFNKSLMVSPETMGHGEPHESAAHHEVHATKESAPRRGRGCEPLVLYIIQSIHGRELSEVHMKIQ